MKLSEKEKVAQQGKKPKKKKTWIIIAVVAVVIIAAASGNTDDAEQTADTSAPNVTEAAPNTSAKVDALALEAKAAVANGFTDKQRDEAVGFIVENYPNYYEGNELMEQAITYGYLLEYAYKDNDVARDYAELGMDLVQAVKYVYRGVESVLDDATRENLLQVRETLERLGYSVDWKQ